MITDPQVEEYLYRMLPPSGALLEEMEAYAGEHDVPIVGPAVAHLLHIMAANLRARRVFELGSAIGYSTLWWAHAVGAEGRVYYTDSDADNVTRARGYAERAGLQDRIEFLEGGALASLEATPGEFDIVFCDLNKDQYAAALTAAVPRLRKGGLFIADNVLWRGEVAGLAPQGNAAHMAAFNQALYTDRRLETTILPLRDGVAVCRVVGQ